MSTPYSFPSPTRGTFRLQTTVNSATQNLSFNVQYKWAFIDLDSQLDTQPAQCVFYTIRDAMFAFFGLIDLQFLYVSNANVMAVPLTIDSLSYFLVCRETSPTSFEVLITDTLNNDPSAITPTLDIDTYTFNVTGGGVPNTPLAPYTTQITNGILQIGGLVYAPYVSWKFQCSSSPRFLGMYSFGNNLFENMKLDLTIWTSPRRIFKLYPVIQLNGTIRAQLVDTKEVVTIELLGNTNYSSFFSLFLFDPYQGIFESGDAVTSGIRFQLPNQEIVLGRFIMSTAKYDGEFLATEYITSFYTIDPSLFPFRNFLPNSEQLYGIPCSARYNLSPFLFQKLITLKGICGENVTTPNLITTDLNIQAVFHLDESNQYVLLGIDGDIQINCASVNWEVLNFGDSAQFDINNVNAGQYFIRLQLKSLISNSILGELILSRSGSSITARYSPIPNKGVLQANMDVNFVSFTESSLSNISERIENNTQPPVPRGIGGNIAVSGAVCPGPKPPGINSSDPVPYSAFLGFSIVFLILFLILLIVIIVLVVRQTRSLKK